jgi:hypothetical protein
MENAERHETVCAPEIYFVPRVPAVAARSLASGDLAHRIEEHAKEMAAFA